MATISKTGIQDGLTSKAEHLTRIIDTLDGTATTEVVATGSFTGSFIGDGSALTGVGGSSGIFLETGSYYATTNNLQITGSLVVTSNITASGNISSSGTLIGGGLNVNGGSITNVQSITATNVGVGTILDAATGGDTNIALTGTVLNIEVGGETLLETTGTTAKFSTNVTASGNISSSFAGNQTGATGVPSISGFEIAAHRYITRTQTITAAGTNQDTATSISAASAIVFANGADNTKGVRLPDSTGIETGTTITIHNSVTNKTLEIYPAVGDSLLPNLSANNPATLPAAATFMCTRFSDGRWVTFVCVGAT